MIMAASSLPAQEKSTSMKPLEIGTRLELFVDDHLVERMTGVAFRLHAPVKQMPAKSPLPSGGYGTIIKDGDLYRAYYRSDIPGYDKGRYGERNADNEPNEITCYAESRDGIEWTFPDLGITKIQSSKGGNVILARQAPFTHNFSPFLDTRPGVAPDARYKALAGGHKSGLVAFKSADGIQWSKIQDAPVLTTPPYSITSWGPSAFDSQNVAFWSEAENRYVCFVRTFVKADLPIGSLRRVSRATSTDFITWTPLVDTDANLPGEQLYTNQTHPYFRAPHIYVALPSRFTLGIQMGEPVEGNYGSTDIMLMTMRAGSASYQRTFKEAFIRPGLDPARWKQRANYVAMNVVPTGPEEMSIYNTISGDRYTLRTDGFISVNAGADGGELLTKPLIFAGDALSVNFSTGAAGSLRVELQDASGRALPGFGLEDCQAVIGDAIERRVRWKNNPDLAAIAGKPVRLRFALRECDVYSVRVAQRAWEGDPVKVGAIRWDAWHTPTQNLEHGAQGGAVKAVERSLSPKRYQFRAPFFTKVISDSAIKIDGYTQHIMDQEIDFAKQGALYLPKHIPEPGRDGPSKEALTELAELIDAAGGRTLALFSSWRGVEMADEYLRKVLAELEIPIITQKRGDSVGTLVERFAKDPKSILLGTISLWQGIDVPGPSCTLVAIDRIPFPRPDEPVMSARAAEADAAGGSGFMQVSLPRAALLLAQGTGRLIRSIDDRGVVAILDSRIVTKRYGSVLLNSMPPFWRTSDGAVIRESLKRLNKDYLEAGE